MTGLPVVGARIRTRDDVGVYFDKAADVDQGPVIETASTARDGRFRLAATGRLLEVHYADGLLAGAVKVSAYRLVEGEEDDFEDSAHADNAGRFQLLGPPGEYRLEFEPPANEKRPQATSRRVTLYADKDNVHTFEIPRP